MATTNPRACTYLPESDHAKLRELMKERNLTESKAIAAIINLYFGGDPEELRRAPMTPQMDDRLSALENQVAELTELKEVVERLGKQLAVG